jgi:hypothetical protein
MYRDKCNCYMTSQTPAEPDIASQLQLLLVGRQLPTSVFGVDKICDILKYNLICSKNC